jgi:hypothetical protein
MGQLREEHADHMTPCTEGARHGSHAGLARKFTDNMRRNEIAKLPQNKTESGLLKHLLKATLPTYGIVEHDWGGLYKVLGRLKRSDDRSCCIPNWTLKKVQMPSVRRSNVKLRLKRILVGYLTGRSWCQYS